MADEVNKKATDRESYQLLFYFKRYYYNPKDFKTSVTLAAASLNSIAE